MNTRQPTKSHYSALVLALAAVFAHTENKQSVALIELDEVKVTATAVPTHATRNQLDRGTSADLK